MEQYIAFARKVLAAIVKIVSFVNANKESFHAAADTAEQHAQDAVNEAETEEQKEAVKKKAGYRFAKVFAEFTRKTTNGCEQASGFFDVFDFFRPETAQEAV